MNKSKHILFIVHALKAGGIETVLSTLSRYFSKSGYEVTIISLSKNDDEQSRIETIKNHGIHLHQCPVSQGNPLQFLLAPLCLIPFFIKNRKFDLIIIPGIVNAIAVIPIIKSMLVLKPKIIVNAHTAFSAYYKTTGKFKRAILWLGHGVLRLADYVANDSSGAAKDLQDHYGLREVIAFYNPIASEEDLSYTPPAKDAPHPWLKDTTITTFVSCGRLVESKNFGHMIRVFAKLYEDDKTLRLLLIGHGPEEEALKTLSNELGLSSVISFEGFVDSPKDYFYHADYFWLSSKFEGFSVVLGEALSMGTPCITNDCPFGPAEVIDHGKYGLLLSSYDEKTNADEISTYIAKPKQGKDYYRRRAQEFLVSKIADQYLALIN